MKLRAFFLCGLCGPIMFPAAAEVPAEAPVSIRYKCDGKQSVQVDYNVPGKTPRAIVTMGKKSWTMKRVEIGTGRNYEDGKKSMAWSATGAKGHLTDLKTNKSIHCTESASSR